MKWQQLIADIYTEISRELERALDGLTADDLNQQPSPDCNSIGWLAWHLTRCQDAVNEGLTSEKQLWIKEKWYSKFDRAADPTDTGYGHSSEDVSTFRAPDSPTLFKYHRCVLENTLRYIHDELTETDLERVVQNPTFPDINTVRINLVGIISDNLQHVGQIAYVRGLLKGKGWSDI
ncbi:DinB family protein [Chloroflexota bacterium]